MNIELPKLSGGVISAEASGDAGVVRVRFSGTADLEAKDDLEVFVKKLHREAVKHTATKVVVDFRELEFMNSSCFKIFVAWLAQLTPSEQNHATGLLADAGGSPPPSRRATGWY